MNDQDRLTRLLDAIDKASQDVRKNGPELLRRARISARADGYPRRSSVAEPALTVSRTVSHAITTYTAPGSRLWGWRCSCGDAHVLRDFGFTNEPDARAAGNFHADRSSALDYADPTGDAGTSRSSPDPVRAAARRLVSHLEAATRSLAEAQGLAVTPMTRAEDGDPGCESCARLRRADGEPTWEPTDPRRQGKTSVGGRLPRPLWLCSWCVTQVGINAGEREVVLPTLDELRTHHSGRNVRRHALHETRDQVG